jgi:hypothetical protein
MSTYAQAARNVPVRRFDVMVAGCGTAGVIAAIAAARQGAKVIAVESKGYPGGIAVEGGTALHSFYNLWKAFPGVAQRQVVRGIPEELIERLAREGGTSGHAEMTVGYDYDCMCTAIDVEIYKRVAFEMLDEAGVFVATSTLVCDAVVREGRIEAVLIESRSGREAVVAQAFVDCTGYGDMAARAGARFTEPNDHGVANSIGLGGVNVEKYREFLEKQSGLTQLALGRRDGKDGQIVRVDGWPRGMPELAEEARRIGLSFVTTTVHDDYFMFIKLNYQMPVSPTDRDAASKAELELRRRQAKAVELFQKYVPGCEKAFITRTSPALCIRRGRVIACDYDITLADVLGARHFDDDVMVYGFHDSAPRLQIQGGGTYGIPYRALLVSGLENLLAAGMLITTDHEAHMSTRNTVCCMGQGQAAGTAAALAAAHGCGARALPAGELRRVLASSGVVLEP